MRHSSVTSLLFGAVLTGDCCRSEGGRGVASSIEMRVGGGVLCFSSSGSGGQSSSETTIISAVVFEVGGLVGSELLVG